MRPLLFALAVAISAPAFAQRPVLVADINQVEVQGPSSDPGLPSEAGSHMVFAATHGSLGRELFVTQGTAATTGLLRDVRPGPESSDPEGFVTIADQHFFAADDGVHGRELWVTDGTFHGTALVADVVPGAVGSAPTELVAVGRTVYFCVASGGAFELWRTDGSTAATVRIEIFAGELSGLTAFAGGVLFVGDDGRSGAEPWFSDGTRPGTYLIRDLHPGPVRSVLGRPYVAGAVAYFAGYDPSAGYEPWITDGTAAGTRQIKDVRPGPSSSFPEGWARLGREVLFTAVGPAGRELRATDGSIAGTRLVKDLTPGPDGTLFGASVVFQSRLFFSASAPINSGLWVTDGTSTGTNPIARLAGGPGSLVVLGNRLLFVAESGNEGRELWRSDGTGPGTVLVADLYPGTRSSTPHNLRADPTSGRVVFAAEHRDLGVEPWVTDGTPQGTAMLADLDARRLTAGSEPSGFVDAHGVLYMTADDGVHGRELWRSNGTAAGTWLVRDIRPGAAGQTGTELLSVDGQLYFVADDGVHGRELWRSDGTAAGTQMVVDLAPGRASGASLPRSGAGGAVYWFGRDAVGEGLFRTDVATSGAVRLAAGLVDANEDPWRFGFHVVGDVTLFAARERAFGTIDLWRTDGTTAGTVRLTGFGNTRSGIGGMLGVHRDELYFAVTSASGISLWKADGTPSGTTKVSDYEPELIVYPPLMVSVGDRAVYTANINGISSLVSTDGTPQGTRVVASMTPRIHLAGLPLVAVNGRAVVLPFNSYWAELWTTDGWSGHRIATFDEGAFLPVGPVQSRFAWLSVLESGRRQVWRTDGTRAGTTPIVDGAGLSSLVMSRGRAFTMGSTDETGHELFSFDPGATVQPFGQACGGSLEGTDPVLGGVATLRGRTASAQGATVILLGVLAVVPAIVEPGCALHFDPGAPVLTFGFAHTGSRWSGQVAIPATPALTGAPIVVQALSFPGSTRLGLDLSNGLLWVPGR